MYVCEYIEWVYVCFHNSVCYCMCQVLFYYSELVSLSSSPVEDDSGGCLMGAPFLNIAKPCCSTTRTFLL